jgi:hypothetical protein
VRPPASPVCKGKGGFAGMLREPMEQGGVIDPMGSVLKRYVGSGVELQYPHVGTVYETPSEPLLKLSEAAPARVVSVQLVDPQTAYLIWSGDEHRDIVFVTGAEGLKMVSVAPPESDEPDD